MKNLNIIKFFGSLFLILFSTKVFSQNPVDVKQINCDSLFNISQSGACISIEKMPTLVESLAETRGKKLSIIVGIPFYSPNTNETNKLIMREGKWYDKNVK